MTVRDEIDESRINRLNIGKQFENKGNPILESKK